MAKLLRILVPLALLAALIPTVASNSASAEVDIYTTPGHHNLNGRQWITTCEPYSQTRRCTTEIWATQVSQIGGAFVRVDGWVFNNLTYAASPRNLWAGNPLAADGVVGGKLSWTGADGRKWRTECDTALTGRNGCRTFVTASIIEAYVTAAGQREYRWVTKEIFNNMVRFVASTQPTPSPDPVSVFNAPAASRAAQALVDGVAAADDIINGPRPDLGGAMRMDLLAWQVDSLGSAGTPPGQDPVLYEAKITRAIMLFESAEDYLSIRQYNLARARESYAHARQETGEILGILNSVLGTSYRLPS